MIDLTGMHMMNKIGYGMMYFGWGSLLWDVIVIGLAVLVWLWVIKLWKEVFRKK